jgi:hypothetical protein
MISLPRGCTVSYNITIDIDELTDEMLDWYRVIEGTVTPNVEYDWRGKERIIYYVKYGKSKPCHYMAGGNGGVRLHFDGSDASVASMFLLKFDQHVVKHNLNEHKELQFG